MYNKYLEYSDWSIVEKGFRNENHMSSESIFSLGNGIFGQRGNFEEDYSGNKLDGNYIGGIFYPDKTKVGWWKVGYPNYFAKTVNCPSWIRLSIHINNEILDLNKVKNINSPLLVLHGLKDKIISIEVGKRVVNSAPKPKEALYIPDAGHNNLYEFDTYKKVISFLKQN